MAENEEIVALDQDHLLEDEVQDWTAINGPCLKTKDETLPKREGKFFDQDGSKTQQQRIEESREQMYLALLHVRGHHVKQLLVGVWLNSRKKALIPHAKGSFFKDIGIAHTYARKKKLQGMWLSPLEAVYLVERGSLIMYFADESFNDFVESEASDFDYSTLKQLPLSHLYGLAIGSNVDLVDKYETYALLKRLGYLIMERPSSNQDCDNSGPNNVQQKTNTNNDKDRGTGSEVLNTGKKLACTVLSACQLLFSVVQTFFLLTPKHFFNYTQIYRLLRLIPTYKPSSIRDRQSDTNDKYGIRFDVWKPSPTFSKKNPPTPDYHVSVLNVNKVPPPSISVLKSLWAQNCVAEKHTPTEQKNKTDRKPQSKFVSKKDQRLLRKQERDSKLNANVRKRNDYLAKKDKLLKSGSTGNKIVFAVVDCGVINFSIFNETEFALEAPATVLELDQLEPRPSHGIVWNERVNL